jgi:hypothetical protein
VFLATLLVICSNLLQSPELSRSRHDMHNRNMGYLVALAALKQCRTSEDVTKCRRLRRRHNGEAQLTVRLSPVTSRRVPVDQSLFTILCTYKLVTFHEPKGKRLKDLSFSERKQSITISILTITQTSATAHPEVTLRAHMQVTRSRQIERSAVHMKHRYPFNVRTHIG